MGSATSEAFDQDLDDSIEAFAAAPRDEPVVVFSGFGGAELETTELGPMFRLVMDAHKRLAEAAPDGIRVITKTYPEETHTSVVPAVIASGLRVMWGTGKVFGGQAAEG
jgi:hypothetical protein